MEKEKLIAKATDVHLFYHDYSTVADTRNLFCTNIAHKCSYLIPHFYYKIERNVNWRFCKLHDCKYTYIRSLDGDLSNTKKAIGPMELSIKYADPSAQGLSTSQFNNKVGLLHSFTGLCFQSDKYLKPGY